MMVVGNEYVEDLDAMAFEDRLPKKGREVTLLKARELQASGVSSSTIPANTKATFLVFQDDQAIVSVTLENQKPMQILVPLVDLSFGELKVRGDSPVQRQKLEDAHVQVLHHPEHRLVDTIDGTGQMTDELMKCLEGLPEVTRLYLNDTIVTDAGLQYVAKLETLKTLSLQGSLVTDAGLVHLENLQLLKRIDLRGTSITKEGVKKLQRAMPRAKMFSGPVDPPADAKK